MMTNKVQRPVVQIFSDGSVYPKNPGRGGWAAVLIYREAVRAVYGSIPNATNNYAEAAAVFNALRQLKKPCWVQIYTDSTYVINGIRRIYKSISRNDQDSILLGSNRELWLAMRPLFKMHIVTAYHVEGHSIHMYNELADELASRGSKQGQEGSFYVGQCSEQDEKLLETVERRIELRKENQKKLVGSMAFQKR